MHHAYGTGLEQVHPWGFFVGGAAMCSDGRVRRLARISATADTFFSVPAAVKVGNKSVSGYVTTETADGWSTETEDDPAVVKFVAYEYGRNAGQLPSGAWKRTPTGEGN